jgi:hypothetical protein
LTVTGKEWLLPMRVREIPKVGERQAGEGQRSAKHVGGAAHRQSGDADDMDDSDTHGDVVAVMLTRATPDDQCSGYGCRDRVDVID